MIQVQDENTNKATNRATNDFSIMGKINVYKEPEYKAELQIGNLQFMSEKKFNWFKRFMLKSVFGIEVNNLK